MPLRPIVSNCGSIFYEFAKYITSILKPLVGQTKFHMKNSEQLVKDLSQITIDDNEEMVSVDVTALFTSIPTDKACQVMRNRLESDVSLNDRTKLTINDIVSLTEMCLNRTYFVFQGGFYQQSFGTAI